MNYIYDILLNPKSNYYDFFEWNENDSIIHIKKIPAFKVSRKELYDIKNNIVKINETFLNTINNKTETFNKDKKNYKYTALFSDSKDILAVIFNKNGINKMKSSLTIDEQDEIINIIKFQNQINLKYNLIKKTNINIFKTRFEIENKNKLINEITKIYNNKESEKINYIYLECFGKKERDINKAIDKIKKEIIKGNDNFYKIFNIFKITNQK